jgi:hypothetical protein
MTRYETDLVRRAGESHGHTGMYCAVCDAARVAKTAALLRYQLMAKEAGYAKE